MFVAVYQKALSLMYVDELLRQVKDAFSAVYTPGSYNYESFNTKFKKILRDCEAQADAARRNAAALPQQPPKAAAVAAAAASAAAGGRGAGQQGGKSGKSGGKASGGAAGGSSDGSEADDADRAAAANGHSATGSGAEGSSGEEEGAAAAAQAGDGGFDVAKLKSLSRKAGGGPPGRRNVRRAAVEVADAKPAVAPAASKKKVGGKAEVQSYMYVAQLPGGAKRCGGGKGWASGHEC